MKLEFPNRFVSIRAQDLADAIDAISAYMGELDVAKCHCDLADQQSIEIATTRLTKLWDRLSEAIETPRAESQNAAAVQNCIARSGLYLDEID